MKKADPFLVLFIFSLLALFAAFLIPWPLPAILLSSACVAAAVLLLYRNLGALSDLPDDHPKLGTLRIVTVFNLTLLLLCTVLAVLLATGAVRLTEDGKSIWPRRSSASPFCFSATSRRSCPARATPACVCRGPSATTTRGSARTASSGTCPSRSSASMPRASSRRATSQRCPALSCCCGSASPARSRTAYTGTNSRGSDFPGNSPLSSPCFIEADDGTWYNYTIKSSTHSKEWAGVDREIIISYNDTLNRCLF